jgi:hypothetical protein
MKKLDEKALTRIEKLAAKAPKGPWVVWKWSTEVHRGPATENTNGCFRGPKGGHTVCEVDDFDNPKPRATVRFIAAARSDVPALCAAVRERDAEIARLRKAIDAAIDDLADADGPCATMVRTGLAIVATAPEPS